MHTANEPSEEYRNVLVALGVGTYWRYIGGPSRDMMAYEAEMGVLMEGGLLGCDFTELNRSLRRRIT